MLIGPAMDIAVISLIGYTIITVNRLIFQLLRAIRSLRLPTLRLVFSGSL